MQHKVIYLVNSPSDGGMASTANDHSFPALAPIALGTWMQTHFPDFEIICRDGGVMSIDDICGEIERLEPWLVGASVLCTTYQNSLRIAETAKGVGAYTVFRNDQASQLGQKILRNRPYVDFVICSEYGEAALELLTRVLLGEEGRFEDIPDLCYRENGEIKGFEYHRDKKRLSILKSPLYKATKREGALDIFPTVNRKLYPQSHWSAYLQNYKSKFERFHENSANGVTTMNRARGCSRSKETIKCRHCDMLLDVSFSSPARFWDEVISAHHDTGADVFWEVCDSFSSFPKFIKGVANAQPADLSFDPSFFVYCQAIDIVQNPDLVKWLRDMGVFRINIGLESGCDITLHHMKGPHDSVAINRRALQLVRSVGIFAYGSFVFGTDAETTETLSETVAWIKSIISDGLLGDVETQPIVPLPNNFYGRKMFASDMLSEVELDQDWPWDTDSTSQRYIDRFSGISYDEALDAVAVVNAAASELQLGYGSGGSRWRRREELQPLA